VARGPLPDDASAAPAGDLRTLHRLAAERYAHTDSYTVRLRRREPAGGGARREEVLACKFRKEPRAASFKWLSDDAKDREVIWLQGRHGAVVHLLTAARDVPLMPLAGKHVKLAPDSAVLKSITRQSLADPGIGALIDQFGAALDAAERGERGGTTLTYQGVLRRSEYEKPLEAVLQVIPAGADPELPDGGERLWFFDSEIRFPVLVITHDPRGEEVGRVCYERFAFPDRLADEEFDADARWRR
jgi:hypothetical protein